MKWRCGNICSRCTVFHRNFKTKHYLFETTSTTRFEAIASGIMNAATSSVRAVRGRKTIESECEVVW